MEAIRDTIKNVMQEWRSKKSSPYNPEALLKKVFTVRELKHVRFHYLRKGVLGVKVESSSWLYHLSLKKQGLLEKARLRLPEIKELRFSIGEVT